MSLCFSKKHSFQFSPPASLPLFFRTSLVRMLCLWTNQRKFLISRGSLTRQSLNWYGSCCMLKALSFELTEKKNLFHLTSKTVYLSCQAVWHPDIPFQQIPLSRVSPTKILLNLRAPGLSCIILATEMSWLKAVQHRKLIGNRFSTNTLIFQKPCSPTITKNPCTEA